MSDLQVPQQLVKRCYKCGETKPADKFYVRRASSDGLQWTRIIP